MTNLAHDTTNDTRYAEFMGEIREFGRNAAMGRDSLPMVAHAFVRAIVDGVLDPAKDSNGDDAAARVFQEDAKAKGKKSVHDRSEESLKANVSKLRQLQKAAEQSKFDFVDVKNRAFTIRDRLVDQKVEVKPAYAAYVDVAREQLKQDTDLTDDQIEAAATPSSNKKEKTVEGQIEKAKKILEDLIAGEKDGLKDQSSEVMLAAEQLNTRLAALLQAAEHQAAIDKALAAGFVLGEDGSLRKAA